MELSIILTTCNRYNLFKKIFYKIFNQTFKDFEVIIIDDSDKENYEQKIFKDYPNVLYKKNSNNIGYARSCLKGLELAKGKYLIFLSDDDLLIDNSFFEKAIHLFNNEKIESVFGRTEIEFNGKIYRNFYPFKTIYKTDEFINEIIKLRFCFLDYFSFSSFIFKTKIFKKINPFDSIFPRAGSVDISNIIKYLLITKKVGFVDVIAYRWYKSRKGSLSGEKKDDLVYQTLQTVSAGIDIYNFFVNKEICKRVCNEYIKYSFNAILSDYEQLNNEKNFKNLLQKLKDKKINEVYIYCRGWVGLELKDFLEKNGIKVLKFIDDFKKDYDDTIDFQNFSKVKEKKNVIIASYKYKDIYLIFKKLKKLKNIDIWDLYN